MLNRAWSYCGARAQARQAAKAEGTELVMPFFKVESWPKAMQAEADQVLHELGEL